MEDGGGNIVLDRDKPSILATLERLQKENVQIMAVVRELQGDNVQLRTQQASYLAMTLEMVSEVRESMQEENQQVQKQVSELKSVVTSIEGQQEMIKQQTAMIQGVMDVVQEFEDEAHNVTSQLTLIQDRLAAVEVNISQLQIEGNDYITGLTSVHHRMQKVESKLQTLLDSLPSPATPSSTSIGTVRTSEWRSTPSPPRPSSTTEGVTSWGTNTPSPTSATTEGVTSWWTNSPSPTSASTDGALSPTLFTIPPDFSRDSLITSILVTKAGELILGDLHASRLTMSRMDTPNDVVDTYGIHRPWAMLELEDGTIVVTLEHQDHMAVLRITNDNLGLVKYIHTERSYYAIAQGPDNTLIVSDRGDELSSTRIDIIDMDGVVQRTLLHDVDFLIHPYCLKRFGDDVYVSDWTSARVFRVNVYTGEAKFTIGDLDLSNLGLNEPRKFDIDGLGNLYLVTGGAVCYYRYFCVIQITQTGSWQEMHDYATKSSFGIYPYGLELTSSQILVSWSNWNGDWSSGVISYSLPPTQAES